MEILQRRKFCREFLNGYNEKLHPQIISKVFEIGLLTLKSKYNKLLFSPEELDEIIMDLSGKKYVEIVPLPPQNHIKKIPVPNNKIPLQSKEDIYFHTEGNDSELYTTKIVKNQKLYEKTLKNPNFSTQNSAIYPNWWWNNKEEEDEEEKPKNNINIVYNEDNLDDENNNNIEYYNQSEINEDFNYQNQNKENESSKNYTIKKLTMNSSNSNRNNRYGNFDENIYNEKPKRNNIPFSLKNNSFKSNKLTKKNIPNKNQKREIKPRVNSLKISNRNNLSNINSNNVVESYNKKFKITNNISQGKKNPKISKIPKYKYTYVNGRVLRIPEQNNSFSNIAMTKVSNIK